MTVNSDILPVYNRIPVKPVRGEGVYIFTADGQKYMDFTAGIGVNALGASHPKMVEIMQDQAGLLWHISNQFEIDGLDELAATLRNLSGFSGKVFVANTGAEANELALKMMRKYQHDRGRTKRHRVISFEGCFHGRTLATIFASNKPRMIEGFGPDTVHYDRVPFGDIDAVRAAITDETAGIIIEPIQGEGGIRAASAEFLQALRDLCDFHDLVLCFDEIQCGAGRTGKFFSYHHHRVIPDIVTAAKGIGAGYPVSAVLAKERVARYMTPGTHGSTYAGGPMAVRIAQTAIDIIRQPGFLHGVTEKGEHLQRRLKDLSHNFNDVVTNVGGKGLMIGLKLNVPNTEFIKRLREDHHFIAIQTADGGMRLLPPLTVTMAEIEHAVDKIRDVAHSFRPT